MRILENDQLRVTISDHGAELSGIFNKKIIVRYSGMQIQLTGNVMPRFSFRM